jgi:N-methylhydantoinase A
VERLDFEGNVLKPLDLEQVAEILRRVQADRAESVAVCLLFSYVNPQHELAVERVLRRGLGDLPVTLSYRVAPQYGEYERTSTTVVNAYVMPVVRRYLGTLEEELAALGVRRLHVMHSSGGLVSASTVRDRPVHTILSGPAAGVVGARSIARAAGRDRIITLDMGGTSTDVAVAPGEMLERDDGEVAGFPLLVPMLSIETVGAGGGSIARVDGAGGLHVGPESAGADPGPAAYGRGSEPTVTDANLLLGRLSPAGLLGGDVPLDREQARRALQRVAERLDLSVEQAAWAIVRLANSNMERAIRTVTLQRGFDPRGLTLVPFGGAGPLHACELAEGLGVATVLVPPHPGVIAALGLTVPDLQRDFHRTVLLPLEERAEHRLERAFLDLEKGARSALEREDLNGFGAPVFRRVVDVRYRGQSFELRVPFATDLDEVRAAFDRIHQQRYGYATPGRPVEMVNARLRAVAPRLSQPQVVPPWPEPGRGPEWRDVWFGASPGLGGLQPRSTQILWRPSLSRGTEIRGPAVVEQYDSATLIPPQWVATITENFDLLLSHAAG